MLPLPRLLLPLCAALLPLAAAAAGPADASHSGPQPTPNLDPATVVRIQLKAMAHNDQPAPDAGMTTVYAFASPENRELTGPLAHFSAIIHKLYAPLLNHRSAQLRPLVMHGEQALQGVEVIDARGQAARYLFILRRRSEPPCAGCWLTDSVLREPGAEAPQEDM